MTTDRSRLDSRLRKAAALHLTVANDPVAGSSRPDDLEVGLAWRPLVLLYRYNEYGTRSGHLTLGVHVTP